MPKLYYPTPDELQGAEPLNELVWFKRYQPWLLRLANTNEGRDLLCLPPWRTHPYRIVSLHKQRVKFYRGLSDGLEHYQSEYHIGAKWGNVIRYRWLEVKKAIDRTILESILAYPPVHYRGRVLHPVGGATSTTFSPDPHPESTSVDGAARYLVTGNGATWATFRAANGNSSNDTAPDGDMGRLAAVASISGNYSQMDRYFYLFDTSSGLTGDTIDSGTFIVKAILNGDSFGEDACLTNSGSGPASNTAIVGADYQTMISAPEQASNRVDVGAFTSGATITFTLNSAGLATIDAAGISKYGGRLSGDLDNSAPTWVGNGGSTPRHHSAEATGTSNDPVLTILHTSVFVPKAIMF